MGKETDTQETTKIEDRRRDSGSKSIFRDKNLMAEMLIGIADEFRNCTREEVIDCLCLDPVDGSVKDLNGELAFTDSGLTRLDTLIEAKVPGTEDKVMVRFNIECQRRFHPGYDLYNRAQFYAGMLLTTQNKELPSVERYRNLKKVYTVWVCLECDLEEAKGTITRYSMGIQPPVGNERTYNGLQNKLCVVMVCLDSGEVNTPILSPFPRVLGILDTIFSGNAVDEDRKKELMETYKLNLDLSLIKEAKAMTNLLQEEYDMGMIEGITKHCVETILMLINNKGFDKETAIDLANVPIECREAVLSQLNMFLSCRGSL